MLLLHTKVNYLFKYILSSSYVNMNVCYLKWTSFSPVRFSTTPIGSGIKIARTEIEVWPRHFLGLGLSTSAGRATGTNKFEDFECPAAKKAPLGHDHFLTKLDDLRNDLKRANEEISKLLGTVKEQELVIKEKNSQLKSSSKKIVDLQRQVQSLGMIAVQLLCILDKASRW